MATNLLESIQQQLTPDMIQHVSTFLGETPAHTQKAVDSAIPTVLAGLMHFSSSSASPIPLLNLLNRAHYGSPLNNLSGLFEGGNTTQNLMTAGREILNTLFAGKLSNVSELIATASGVTNTSASSLLSIAAPVVVGVLERMRSTQGLNAARLATLLMGQKEIVAKLAPEGLARVFGLHSIAELDSGPEGEAIEGLELDTLRRVAAAPVKGESRLKNWGWPVLAVVALGLIYFFIMDRGVEVAQAPMVTVVSADTPAVVTVPLPDGTALYLKEGSFNYNVAAFLRDNAMSTTPKTFVFDRLHFDSGTTKLTVESEQTVKDLGAILKAYPTSDVRLDGYTDNVGDAATNKQLSLDRATAVREALISDGMDAARVTTAGYGQENPLAYNGTEEGRAKNRRLELIVVKK
jgi:outer membrane protein OmpA-like peptidoglycan-associated protein